MSPSLGTRAIRGAYASILLNSEQIQKDTENTKKKRENLQPENRGELRLQVDQKPKGSIGKIKTIINDIKRNGRNGGNGGSGAGAIA